MNNQSKIVDGQAMVLAAMMEELGISRLDDLPLADRGYAINIDSNALPLPANQAASSNPWQNVTVEEDASMEGLDNIADGQLYRMRRGVSSTNSSHLPPRGGRHARGRSMSFLGGRMNRGQRGHFSNRGPSSSRGHSPSRGRGQTAAPHRGRTTSLGNPQFIDGRQQGPGSNQYVDSTISRLRGTISTMPAMPQTPPRDTSNSSRGTHQQAAPAVSKPRLARDWNINNTATFLAHIGQAPVKAAPVQPVQVPEIPKDVPATLEQAALPKQAAPLPVQGPPLPEQAPPPAILPPAQLRTGLASSRWAGGLEAGTAAFHQRLEVAPSNIHSQMTHLYENSNVKVSKNGSQIHILVVALYISSGSVMLEVKATDGTIKLFKAIEKNDLFKVADCVVTYRAHGIGTPSFRFIFGTPLDALKFHNSKEQASTQLSEKMVPTHIEHLPVIQEEAVPLTRVENSTLTQENPVSWTQAENSTLIEFDQDQDMDMESEPAPSSSSALMDLIPLQITENLARGFLGKLDEDPDDPFLKQCLRVSGAELDGNSPELLDAAELIIGNLLNMSQRFEGFGVHKAAYITELSRKCLQLATERVEPAPVEESPVEEDTTFYRNVYGDDLSDDEFYDAVEDPELRVNNAQVEVKLPQSIVYGREELIRHRRNASSTIEAELKGKEIWAMISPRQPVKRKIHKVPDEFTHRGSPRSRRTGISQDLQDFHLSAPEEKECVKVSTPDTVEDYLKKAPGLSASIWATPTKKKENRPFRAEDAKVVQEDLQDRLNRSLRKRRQ